MAMFNLVTYDNGVGLSRDIEIIRSTLVGLGHETRYLNWKQGAQKSLKGDVNLFLEVVNERLFSIAPRNWLLVNPEYYSWPRLLNTFDVVFTKSKAASETFGTRSHFVGFTSIDRQVPGIPRRWDKWLHLAGKSRLKGTSRLYNLWCNHPEWPQLVVVRHPSFPTPTSLPANVTWRSEYLDDVSLARLQNECAVHVCPSEAEGFGHYISEAFSTGSIVITTDAPPMNELVRPDWGVLCGANDDGTMRFGRRYLFKEWCLVGCVEGVLDMSLARRNGLSTEARLEYERQRDGFRTRFSAAVEDFLSKPSRRSSHTVRRREMPSASISGSREREERWPANASKSFARYWTDMDMNNLGSVATRMDSSVSSYEDLRPEDARLSLLGLDSSAPLRILDFGCGTGRHLAWLTSQSRSWRITGYDNPAMLQSAKLLARDVIDNNVDRLVLSSDWPRIRAMRFDYILAFYVLQHINAKYLDKYVADFAAMCPTLVVHGRRSLDDLKTPLLPIAMQYFTLERIFDAPRFAATKGEWDDHFMVVLKASTAPAANASSSVPSKSRRQVQTRR